MRSLLVAIALTGIAVTAAADDGDEETDLPADATTENLQPVVWKYTAHVTTPETLLAVPDAACKQWAVMQAANGYHHSFVKVVPSTEAGYEGSYDCVFKNQDWNNEQWTQSHGAEDVATCPAFSEVVSNDGSGTDASQRCRCTDEAHCAAAPPPPPPPDDPPAADPAPDAAPVFPYAPDKSKRCKQQRHKRRASPRAAQRKSDANQQAVQNDPDQAGWANDYNQILARVEHDQQAAQQTTHGAKASAFPDFAAAGGLCENGGVTDVNIGLLCGSYSGDFAAANNVAGYNDTPSDRSGPCTWHHHEELGRMVLVKRSVHSQKAAQHWGGVSVWKRAFGLTGRYPR